MSKEKMFESILRDQKKYGEEKEAGDKRLAVRQSVSEGYENILNERLKKLPEQEAQKLQDDYEKYLKAEKEVFEEKGGGTSLDDIKEKLPEENLWIKILEEMGINNEDLEKLNLPSFDEIWKEYEKQKTEEKLKKAKKDNKIH